MTRPMAFSCTMDSYNNVVSLVVTDLEVTDLDKNVVVPLPEVLSRPSMPASKVTLLLELILAGLSMAQLEEIKSLSHLLVSSLAARKLIPCVQHVLIFQIPLFPMVQVCQGVT